jgi:hypothetical protein
VALSADGVDGPAEPLAEVGSVCRAAAADAAESARVPRAAWWRRMTTAITTPEKLNTAITHDAVASPEARASDAGWPAAVRSAITVA